MFNDVKTKPVNSPKERDKRNKILAAIIIIVLLMTNPSEGDFAKSALKQENVEGGMLAEGLVKLVTTRDNYFLFSVFKMGTLTEQKVYIGFLKVIMIPLG